MTEIPKPLTVRRMVAFSRAVYEQDMEVEGISGSCVTSYEQAMEVVKDGKIAVIVDPEAKIRDQYKPDVIIDAILAKRNTGTIITDAPFVIGVGPGFTAGEDCHCVIETKRGHTLGSVIWKGAAIPNTGVPGNVGGYTIERLIRASGDGKMRAVAHIGDLVQEGQIVAYTGEKPVYAKMTGIVRGMLQDDVEVEEHLKIGDIDARCERFHCFTVSDKARSIGGAALEAITCFERLYGKYAIVILAAGAGKRFGSNKLLTIIQGKPLYEHMMEKAKGLHAFPIYVVTGYPEIAQCAKKNQFHVVENTQPDLGIARSVKLGLEACLKDHPEIKGVLFSVCDQPNLTLHTMLKMIRTGMLYPGKIICSGHDGTKGNPVLWDQKYLKELFALEGDVGGKQILAKHLEQCVVIETEAEELKDVDRKDDITE